MGSVATCSTHRHLRTMDISDGDCASCRTAVKMPAIQQGDRDGYPGNHPIQFCALRPHRHSGLEVVVIPVSDVESLPSPSTPALAGLDADVSERTAFASCRRPRWARPTLPRSFGSNADGRPHPTVPLKAFTWSSPTSRWRTRLLPSRGAEMGGVFHDAGGVFHHKGTDQRLPGPHPARSIRFFASFSDPDGNGPAAAGGHGETSRSHRRQRRCVHIRRRSSQRRCEGLLPPMASMRSATAKRDESWPEWYADYLVKEQAGQTLPT